MVKTKLALVTTLAMTLGTSFVVYGETGEPKDFVIYHTNDTHSRVDVFGYVATLMDESEAEGSNVLYFDAGDTLHGQPIATSVKGESITKILNASGAQMMTTGNHDYDYGLDRLIELSEMLDLPIVASNVYYKGTNDHIFNDYQVLEVDGVKIGVFGLATPETLTKTNPNNVANVTFADPKTEAERVTKILKEQEGCDVVVSLAHLGVDESTDENLRSTYVAEQVDDIDIMIDGHSHTEIPGEMYGDTLLVQTGEYGNNIGKLSFDVVDGEVVNLTDELLPTKDAEGKAIYESDEEVLKVIDEEKAAVEEVNKEVVGETPYALEGSREVVRVQESNLADLITEAMISETGADVALTNGGGIRASIDAGEITKGEIVTVLPFGNFLVTETITGQQLKDALELGYSTPGQSAGFFTQVGGINVIVDTARPTGERVVSITFDNGKEFDLNAEYTVATNDFMVAGGDGYTMLADKKDYREYNALDEVLIDHINSGNATFTEGPQGRIKFVENYQEPNIDRPVVEKPVTPEQPVTTLPAYKTEVYNSQTSKTKLEVVDGTSYIGVRELVNALGGTVVWDKEHNTAFVQVGTNKLELTKDSNQYVLNAKIYTYPQGVKLVVKNDKLYLPARFLGETLGYTVNYDAATKAVSMYIYK